MENNSKEDIFEGGERRVSGVSLWLRVLCAACAVLLVAVVALGCACFATSADLDAAELKLREASREASSLKTANKALSEEIATLSAANKALEGSIRELEDTNAGLSEEIAALEEQIKELEEALAPMEKIRIYIDQGHNPTSYYNSGAYGNGIREEDVTFEIGRQLARILEEDGRFDVCLSRPTASTVLGTDNDSSLEARVKGARDFEADYFISLHANSLKGDSSVSGIEVFVYKTEGEAYKLAGSLLSALSDSTGLKERSVKRGDHLFVLREAEMPAVLVEMGFLSNKNDAELLSQRPELFASGLYDGITAHFGLTPKLSFAD